MTEHTDTITRSDFLALGIPQVSYHDYKQCGDLAAVRALSSERVAALAARVVSEHCPECGEPVYAIDYHHPLGTSGPAYHGACWTGSQNRAAEAEAARPVLVWPFHAHGSDWSGVDGEVEAKTEDEAHAKVKAWVQRQYGLPADADAIGGSDELGIYIKLGEPR